MHHIKTKLISKTQAKWIFTALACAYSLLSFPVSSAIYFNAKVGGPVTNIYAIEQQGKLTKLTQNRVWRDLQPSVSKLGELVFMSNRQAEVKVDLNQTSEVFNIYHLDPKSNRITPLTNNMSQDVNPQFSPDGHKLAFIRFIDKKKVLYIMDLESNTELEVLRAEDIFGYSWANTQEVLAIAIKQGDHSQLLSLKLDGLTKKPLLQTRRSADKDDISSTVNNLSNLNSYRDQSEIMTPVWSTDDSQIAFIFHPTKRGEMRQLALYPIDTGVVKLVSPANISVQSPVQWSKDNHSLLYSGLQDYRYYYDEQTQRKTYLGSMQIFMSKLTGSTVQLTQGDHLHRNPVFSPDGRNIAYLYADELGGARHLSLRTMALDGSHSKQIFDRVARQSSLLWR
ncbi:TolB family protein [Shewanella violacea]|uniref:Uncharacterized protein n=1 Tax=Shewanella violacea (strain JCM 10179 / CIP 106290 / LMG 19151 / DSS12) TaxID=637905 RepID=D4ZGP5_SHEVD|nr:PD40 domain-containing protein [Shewanella violacea]BAJ00844.1 hypothetical protein SVI_0873 [Shewanella violacea DSS12]